MENQKITINLTGGNIRNNHFYLSNNISVFPDDVIGGSSRQTSALKTVTIEWGLKNKVVTDIAGDKKIFRERTWVGEFFKTNQLKEGDQIILEKIDPYFYRVYPVKCSVS